MTLGTAIMPQNPEYLNILKNEDVAVRSAGAETAGNKLDRHEKKLDPREQTVEVQKRVLGVKHADTLQSMYNPARSYYSQGRQYGQAVQLEEQTAEVQKRVVGTEHPDTPRSMHNLAKSYYLQGQYE